MKYASMIPLAHNVHKTVTFFQNAAVQFIDIDKKQNCIRDKEYLALKKSTIQAI